MKTAVRSASLDMSGLAKAEVHGKRLDHTSQRRRIREASPLVIGGLDLRALYDEHVAGARMNAGTKKPVLHMIVRVPPELLDGPGGGPFVGVREDRQRAMLNLAVAWANESHGGDAVFAARLDRDEQGETICDLFLAPRYSKETKRRRGDDAEQWVSPTKFGKDLAIRHQDEIQRRHPQAKGILTGPRHVGIALQSDWREFFERETGLKLIAKVEKGNSAPDRIEKEAHDRIRVAEAEALRRVRAARSAAQVEVAEAGDRAAKMVAEAEAIRAKSAAEARAIGAAFSALAVEIENGTLTMSPAGKPSVKDRAAVEVGGAGVFEAARVIAPLLDGAREDRRAAADAWAAADAARSEAEGLLGSLRSLLRRARNLLRRHELTGELRNEAQELLADPSAELLLEEEPFEETGSPGGPGV